MVRINVEQLITSKSFLSLRSQVRYKRFLRGPSQELDHRQYCEAHQRSLAMNGASKRPPVLIEVCNKFRQCLVDRVSSKSSVTKRGLSSLTRSEIEAIVIFWGRGVSTMKSLGPCPGGRTLSRVVFENCIFPSSKVSSDTVMHIVLGGCDPR